MKRIQSPWALVLLLTNLFIATSAEEVVIPDAALKSAIWQTLGRPLPVGALTEQDMLSLTNLNASARGVMRLDGLGAAHNLTTLYLYDTPLSNLTLPGGLTSLTALELNGNQLTSLTLPEGFVNLSKLDLGFNALTSLILPVGLTNLTTLNLYNNQLASFTFPAGLTHLTTLDLGVNPLDSLIFPPELTGLTALALWNVLPTTFVLPEPLADGELAGTVAELRSLGVPVSTYPLRVILQFPVGRFGFRLSGPPGTYRIQVTEDFSTWGDIHPVTNVKGSVLVTDPSASSHNRGFYRAIQSN